MLACEVRYRHGADQALDGRRHGERRQRSLACRGARRVARALPLPRQGEGGPFRDLGPRPRGEGGDGTRARERIRDRGRSHRAGCRTRQGCRSSDALGAGGGAARLGWRPGPDSARRRQIARQDERSRRQWRQDGDAPARRLVRPGRPPRQLAVRRAADGKLVHLLSGRRPGQGPLQHLVRDVPALRLARSRDATAPSPTCAPARLRRADGLRRPLPAARSTRSAAPAARVATGRVPRGSQRPGEPVGHRSERRAATKRSIPSSARSRTSASSSQRPPPAASTSRSTWPSRPRRTIPG